MGYALGSRLLGAAALTLSLCLMVLGKGSLGRDEGHLRRVMGFREGTFLHATQ